MPSQSDIENRVNQIIGVIGPSAAALNDVLDPLVDMLARSQHVAFADLKKAVLEDANMAKLDLLENVARRIAMAESHGDRYTDDALFDKVRGDLNQLAQSVASTQRNHSGPAH